MKPSGSKSQVEEPRPSPLRRQKLQLVLDSEEEDWDRGTFPIDPDLKKVCSSSSSGAGNSVSDSEESGVGDEDEEDDATVEEVKTTDDTEQDEDEEDDQSITCECVICPHKTTGNKAATRMKAHIESIHRLTFDKLKTSYKVDPVKTVKQDRDEVVDLIAELKASKTNVALNRRVINLLKRKVLEPPKQPQLVSDLYFESYDELSIHHEMIFDTVRTNAYREAIVAQHDRIKDHYVMDVGCGSGILSMFCAQQGAKRVFAVDNSDIILSAVRNSQENGFDSTIKFFHKDIDKEDLLIDERVDVIVSEFMGYFLFFEGMTETIIRTRDKYLKPGGLMLPNACAVYLQPLGRGGIYQSTMDCWDNVFGFKMSDMKRRRLKEFPVKGVSSDEVIGVPVCVKNLDLYLCSISDIQIDTEFVFRIDEDTEFCGVAGFFSVTFSREGSQIVLSTGPLDPPTHWEQAVFLLPSPRRCSKGEELSCRLKSYAHHQDPRCLVVEITVDNTTHKYAFE